MRALLDLDTVDVGESPFAAGFVSILKMHCGAEASIWKLDDLSRLVLVASTDITDKKDVKAVNRMELTKGQGVSGQAVLERRTISFHGNASQHQHDARVDGILRKNTHSMVSAPIALDARCVHGVLNLINPRAVFHRPT